MLHFKLMNHILKLNIKLNNYPNATNYL